MRAETTVKPISAPSKKDGHTMTIAKGTTRYNNTSKNELLGLYKDDLEASGMSESIISGHVWAARSLLDLSNKPVNELSDEDFMSIEKKVRKKYTQRTANQYIPNMGHFVYFVTGRNPYAAIKESLHYQSPWLDRVKHTECRFAEEVDAWVQSLKEEGISENTSKEHGRKVRICLQAFDVLGIVKELKDYDIDDIMKLEEAMSDFPPKVRGRYIKGIRRFLKVSPEKEVLDISLEQYADYLRRTKGFKETTIESKMQAVRSIMFNLKSEFGRDYDPLEVDADLILALINRLSGRIKESALDRYVICFRQYVDWLSGEKDHMGEINILWNGNFIETADRKFISKDEFSRLITVAEPDEYVILALGAGEGLRLSEIANL